MHRHGVGRIIVGLSGGVLTRVEENGEKSPLFFDKNTAQWFAAEPEGILHGDLNETNKPIEVIVVEVKAAQP